MPPSNREGSTLFRTKNPVGLTTSALERRLFYRDELLKHWQCLEQQRESYSEKAITDVEAALTRLLGDVDRLCARKGGDVLVSRLLRKIDGVTRLSAWSDPKKHH